jgi:hypothetical protein
MLRSTGKFHSFPAGKDAVFDYYTVKFSYIRHPQLLNYYLDTHFF